MMRLMIANYGVCVCRFSFFPLLSLRPATQFMFGTYLQQSVLFALPVLSDKCSQVIKQTEPVKNTCTRASKLSNCFTNMLRFI